MNVEGVGGNEKQTGVEQAKELAADLVRNSPRQSRWAIQHLSDSRAVHGASVYSRERTATLAAIGVTPFGAGNGKLVEALEFAVDGIEKENEPHSRITVISDFQKSMCDNEDEAKWAALRMRLEKMEHPPTIVMLPTDAADRNGSSKDNVTVRFDPQSRSIVGIGQPWEARIVVKNYGKMKIDEAKLILSVDEVPMVSKSLSVPAQSESQASFSLGFPVAGSHRIEVRIDADDALQDDNRSAWSVFAVGTIPILIVDPTIDGGADRADSDFLQTALSPFAGIAKSRDELFAVRRITPDKLNNKEIDEARMIILVDVPKLSDEVSRYLLSYVRSGGVLGMFLGERVDTDWYNKRLTQDIGFSMKLREKGKPAEVMSIRREQFRHPAFRFLNDSRMIGLESLEFQRWNSVTVSDEKIDVLMQMNNGDPWLMERRLDSGVVLICTTSCDDQWTNWPVRPLFLPMIQQWLVTATPIESWKINAEAGETLSVPSDTLIEWMASESNFDKRGKSNETKRLGFRNVSGGSEDENKNESSIVGVQPGFYEIIEVAGDSTELVGTTPSLGTPSPKTGRGEEKRILVAAVQAPITESNLESTSIADLRVVADRLGAKVVESVDDYFEIGDPSGREMWRWILIGLLVFLFAELFLQRSFVGARG